MKKKIIKKIAKKVANKVTGKKKPKIKKKIVDKTATEKTKIKSGPKTANPANAPSTREFVKITKGAKWRDMSSSEKSNFAANFWGKQSNRKER